MPVLARRLLFVSFLLVILGGCKQTPTTASKAMAKNTGSKHQTAQDTKHDSTEPGANSADPAPNGDPNAVSETARPTWPDRMGEFSARSRASIPYFPVALSGYRSEANKVFRGKSYLTRGSIRVEDGDDWRGLKHFPRARNGCSSGLFMLRWRLSDPAIKVYSTIDNPDKSPAKVATGTYGYMYGSVCDKPQFKFAKATKPNWSKHVDVFYESKFWQATP